MFLKHGTPVNAFFEQDLDLFLCCIYCEEEEAIVYIDELED